MENLTTNFNKHNNISIKEDLDIALDALYSATKSSSADVSSSLTNKPSCYFAGVEDLGEAFAETVDESISNLRHCLCATFPLFSDVQYERIFNRKRIATELATVRRLVRYLENEGDLNPSSTYLRVFECRSVNQKVLEQNGFQRRPLILDFDWFANDWRLYVRQRILGNLVVNDNCKSFWFYGSSRVGKTTLLTAIAVLLNQFLRIDTHFITMPSLVKLVNGTTHAQNVAVDKLKNCDALFIDDVGCEKYANSWQESLVCDFLIERLNNLRINVLSATKRIKTLNSENLVYERLMPYLNDKNTFECFEVPAETCTK